MDNIERPVSVSRNESITRNAQNNQEYTQNQLTTIYDYLDSVASTINSISVLDQVYPVGSVYMSFNNVSPTSFIGGTWERINDRFLWATSDPNYVGTAGGNYKINTSHRHLQTDHFTLVGYQTNKDGYQVGTGAQSTTSNQSVYTDYQGGEVDILPPYIAVNMWRRTA